jgi:hypothetical protein
VGKRRRTRSTRNVLTRWSSRRSAIRRVGQSRAGTDDTILKYSRRLVSGLHFAFESSQVGSCDCLLVVMMMVMMMVSPTMVRPVRHAIRDRYAHRPPRSGKTVRPRSLDGTRAAHTEQRRGEASMWLHLAVSG